MREEDIQYDEARAFAEFQRECELVMVAAGRQKEYCTRAPVTRLELVYAALQWLAKHKRNKVVRVEADVLRSVLEEVRAEFNKQTGEQASKLAVEMPAVQRASLLAASEHLLVVTSERDSYLERAVVPVPGSAETIELEARHDLHNAVVSEDAASPQKDGQLVLAARNLLKATGERGAALARSKRGSSLKPAEAAELDARAFLAVELAGSEDDTLACDGFGGDHTGERRRLELGGGAGAILCKRCFDHEMWWRARRNEHLQNFRYVTKPDPIPCWEDLKIYTLVDLHLWAKPQ